MPIYWLSKLFLLISQFQNAVHYLEPVFAVLVFIKCGAWAKVLVSLCFMAMTCNTGGLQQQGGTDVAVDLYLAVRLLFTGLALALASVFVRPRGAEGGRPREPAAAEAARESGPGDQAAAGAGPEAGREQLPVEEAGEGEEREEAAEEPSPAGEPSPREEPSPATAGSIPRKPPSEPQENVESKVPPLGATPGPSRGHPGQLEDVWGYHEAVPSKAEEEGLDSEEEKLVVREPASTAATPAPVTSTASSSESSEGFEWPLGTLGTCLLIVMGISMLAHTQIVFYPQPFCLISEVKQSQVWVLSGVRRQYSRIRRFSPRLDSHERQGVWDSMGKYLVHWAPPVLWKCRSWKAATTRQQPSHPTSDTPEPPPRIRVAPRGPRPAREAVKVAQAQGGPTRARDAPALAARPGWGHPSLRSTAPELGDRPQATASPRRAPPVEHHRGPPRHIPASASCRPCPPRFSGFRDGRKLRGGGAARSPRSRIPPGRGGAGAVPERWRRSLPVRLVPPLPVFSSLFIFGGGSGGGGGKRSALRSLPRCGCVWTGLREHSSRRFPSKPRPKQTTHLDN
ncbi:uncharacterized protein LOC134161647 [Pezoporus occidentalis]|uniref:uncharacterized protein LOC134161647 n=1 Tax=Pezoporus occidentalis TaxID=407982 RepID=UPI002F91BA0F